MSVIQRASFGYLIRHPWQLGLALLGICIGVAVVVAVDLANQSSSKAYLRSMDTINGTATHQIVGGPNGLDETLYVKLRVDGRFRNVAPVVSGFVDIGATTVYVLGVDVFAEREFRQFSSPSSDIRSTEAVFRRLLTEPGAAIMSPEMAAMLAIEPGEDFELLANGKPQTAVLVGLPQVSEASAAVLNDMLIVDISTAQRWLDSQALL